MGQAASRERDEALAALKPINNSGELPTSLICFSQNIYRDIHR